MKTNQMAKILEKFLSELSHLDSDVDEDSGSVAAVDTLSSAAAQARNEIQELLRPERRKGLIKTQYSYKMVYL